MASLTNSSISLSIFLLIVTISPLAHGQLINVLNIIGNLTCSATGNPPAAGSPLGAANVPISFRCGNTTLGTGATNPTGGFSIRIPLPALPTFPRLLLPILNITSLLTNCSVIVNLPVNSSNNCTSLPVAGILQAPLSFLNLLPVLVGGIGNFVATAFQLIP